jgi:DtxR family Mn-dependent transcriptional regulator
MLPSSTVENYLKTIYLGSTGGQGSEPRLLPMGQLAAAVGVTPGTATTMVKTLAESGLVRYEPYMGVRLTAAGETLASRVLRRHRLIELFLVKILGMNWTDVHDEAERLEHAVSEQLVDRMDEMLGHPLVDPHGDPIPTAEGTMPAAAAIERVDLLGAPLATPLVVTRVLDQDAEFLRYVEEHHLMPGSSISVEARDPGSDAVRLRSAEGIETTLGTRAASRILVRLRH